MKRGTGLRVPGRDWSDFEQAQAQRDADYWAQRRAREHAAMLAEMGQAIAGTHRRASGIEKDAEREVTILARRVAAMTVALRQKDKAHAVALDRLQKNFEASIAALPESVRKIATDLLLKSGIAEKRVEKTAALVQPEPVLAPATPKRTAKRKIVLRDKNNRVTGVVETEIDDATAAAEIAEAKA